MRGRVAFLVLFLLGSVGFCEVQISRMFVRGENFYISLRTFPPQELNPFRMLEMSGFLEVGYHIRVFKKVVFPELDIFLTNVIIRYEIARDYLNSGYVAAIWYGGDFAYKRWFETDESLLRFIYRLDNFRVFTFKNPKADDYFYLEIIQYFDSSKNPETKGDVVGPFFRSLFGLRYEFSPVRSRVFNRDGIFNE